MVPARCSPTCRRLHMYVARSSPFPSNPRVFDVDCDFLWSIVTVLTDTLRTDKDAAAAIGKIWGKVRKKPSAASISDSAAAALAIEKEGKIGGAEDEERVENVIYEHDDEHLEDGHGHHSPHLTNSRGRTSNASNHHTLSREDLLPPHVHVPLDRERSIASQEGRSEDSSVATPEDSDVEMARKGVRNGKQKELEINPRQAML